MEYIYGFIVLSAIVMIAAGFIFPHTVTWQEGLIGVGVQGAVIAVIFFGAFYGSGRDLQILNGMVTDKQQNRVSCEHSYRCRCRTTCSGSGKSRSCSQTCDTCYEHSFDYDWDVYSSVGNITIDRVDRQGTEEPPRWSQVKIGEFFAKESSYFNYIKASPLTIFDKSKMESDVEVPSYLRVHDYYRINRVINHKSKFNQNLTEVNDLLNEALKTLGSAKKVNVVMIYHQYDPLYVEAVRAKMLGGKINDVTVMINAENDGKVRSVNVFSWSRNDLVNVAIRDAILDHGVLDAKPLVNAITTNIVKHYDGKDIEEFQYLEANIDIPDWAFVLIMIFGLVFPFGWGYIAHAHIEVGQRFNFNRKRY